MNHRNWKVSVVCCVLALLVSVAHSQSWPKRYDFNSGTDEASAVAVDHRGNVFVAGKIYTGSTEGYDFGIISYDPSGNLRSGWPVQYTGPGQGADIPTAIAVDWQGNVYVAGVSLGSSTNNDFTVISYDSDGNIRWPTTGSGTGFVFHQGAIRLSDNNNDGVDIDDPDIRVCAMAMRNTAGSQPTFAITDPTKNGSNNTQWRSVVFEDDGSGAVRIKSGWPLTEFGTVSGQNDQPYAVAIHTDNSVYVTGSAHFSGSSLEKFTTVRYHPNGTTSEPEHYWIDTFATDGKPAEGRSIALDGLGDAYVTGTLTYASGSTYQTIKIQKDPASGGGSVELWSAEYGNSFDANEASSISLSFEVDGTTQKTFVYVTGKSEISGTFDIATLRYVGSGATGGTQVWARTYTGEGNDDVGLQVVGAGDGNCYVVGRTRNDSGNDDYVLLGYKKDGTTNRFNPVIYNNGFTDEARSAAMGGAGLVYFTGKSGASSTNLDFLTTRNVETVTSYVTDTVSASGGSTNGTTTNLATSDNSYYSIHPYAASGGGYEDGVVTFETTLETSNPSEMSITIESKVDKNGIWQKVEVYDRLASTWIEVNNQPAVNGTDTNTVIVLKDSPARFIDGSDVAKVRVTHYVLAGYSAGSYYAYFDIVRWDVIGT